MITGKITLHMVCFSLGWFTADAVADASATPPPSVTLGIAAINAPRYSGADKQHWQLLPLVQARDGALFFDSQKGVGYDLQTDNGFYLEHTLGYGLGRSDRNSSWRDGDDRLRGMGKIDPTLNTSLALGWSVTPWLVLEEKATLPLSDSQGVQYRTSVTLIPWQTSSDTVALQVAALSGDGRYMNTWYGVSSQQSAQSGFKRYGAAGGFYGTDSSLTWSHQFTSAWAASVIADYTWLDKHAADSPVVARRNNVSATLALSYTF
ncbi:MipA/OmpV family protein [Pantoea sp.]|uniref:MipA/OmpV family protein n=1 Tax=Pantoea sp. TaxID=69393 RepID=UPI0028ABC8FB|nr:MipA/OmpV family protein [Pantoea sp.]